MADPDYDFFQDAILLVFRKRKTAFLRTESILEEVRFQKEIYPKEDKERLDSILETMREKELVTLNQPKFAALTPAGKRASERLDEARIAEIEKIMNDRLK